MKISEAKEIINNLQHLSKNLENLRCLSTGILASQPDKDKANAWCNEVEEMAGLGSPLPQIYETAKNVVDNEIDRLNRLIDDAEIQP